MNAKTLDPDDEDTPAAASTDAGAEELAQALMASRVLVDAPEELIQRTLALFQPVARPAQPAQLARQAARALLPRLRAALQFDSAGAAPLAFGMRSAGGDMRQLLYALPDCDVDLRVVPDVDGCFSLSGQLLGPACQGVVFAQPERLVSDGDASRSAALNDLGEFRLPPLPAGAWRLTLELADRTLELPPLDLAAGRGAPA